MRSTFFFLSLFTLVIVFRWPSMQQTVVADFRHRCSNVKWSRSPAMKISMINHALTIFSQSLYLFGDDEDVISLLKILSHHHHHLPMMTEEILRSDCIEQRSYSDTNERSSKPNPRVNVMSKNVEHVQMERSRTIYLSSRLVVMFDE